MHTRLIFPMLILAACIILPRSVPAAEAEKAPQTQNTRSKMIFGVPVNVNMAGPGSMPEGVLYTAINASFSDKVTPHGNTTRRLSDSFNQAWLLKVRYGITEYLEIWSTTPYTNSRRTNPEPNPQSIYGINDTVVCFTFGPWHERRGDPFTASASAGVWVPMAAWGADHPAGLGVMGFRGQAAVGKFLTNNIKIETEGVWTTRFGRGNQGVRLGDQFQWNSQIRYLFDYFDIGLESTLVRQLTSDQKKDGRTRDMRSKSTEWFVGPSVNFAIDPLGMWVGVGALFPVMQDYQSPTKAENVRFELKIAKLW